MATVINTTFKLKRGTAARWAEINPILAQGEPGFVYDQNRLKIGDGVTAWNNLPYTDQKVANDLLAEITNARQAEQALNERINTKVNTVTYAADKADIEAELIDIRQISEEALGTIDAFLNSEEIDETVNTLKEIQVELEKLSDTTEIFNTIEQKADITYVDNANASLLAQIDNIKNDYLTSKDKYDDSVIKIMLQNEEARALAAEKALAENINKTNEAIIAINDEENGILNLAKQYTNESIANIPIATALALGLIKFDDLSIKMNNLNQLYIAKVSTDTLELGLQDLVLCGGGADN